MDKSSGSGTANDAAVDTSTDTQRPDDYSHSDLVERLERKVVKAEEQLKDAKAALAAAKKEG